jgi:hypothetical protein
MRTDYRGAVVLTAFLLICFTYTLGQNEYRHPSRRPHRTNSRHGLRPVNKAGHNRPTAVHRGEDLAPRHKRLKTEVSPGRQTNDTPRITTHFQTPLFPAGPKGHGRLAAGEERQIEHPTVKGNQQRGSRSVHAGSGKAVRSLTGGRGARAGKTPSRSAQVRTDHRI